MAIITFPSTLAFVRQGWGQKRFDLGFENGDSGAQQTRILAPPRWLCSLNSDSELDRENSAAWRALILSLQGRLNQLAMWDELNPAPRGTLRGSLTLAVATDPGARTLLVTGGPEQAYATLLAGDWIGVGSGVTRQLVSVVEDVQADASGVISPTFTTPMRYVQALGSPVVWDRPTALFRMTAATSQWEARTVNQGGYSLDLMESWE